MTNTKQTAAQMADRILGASLEWSPDLDTDGGYCAPYATTIGATAAKRALVAAGMLASVGGREGDGVWLYVAVAS